MRINKLLRKQHGDTIVEVLIAIAVSSAVLGTAYGITNRTVKNQQQINEHSQALKIAEQQLEQLRGMAAVGNSGPFSATSPFCIVLVGSTPTVKTPDSDGSCKTAGVYNVAVIRTGGNLFTAAVTWDGIHGGIDKVSLDYKVYQ